MTKITMTRNRRQWPQFKHDRQKRLLKFICEYIRDEDMAPRRIDCARALDCSPATIVYHLNILDQLGFIKLEGGKNRDITVTGTGASWYDARRCSMEV